MEFKEVKIEIYIPEEYIILLRDELNKINACRVGAYDNCISITHVKGYWKPLQGSNPYNGQIGELCSGEECNNLHLGLETFHLDDTMNFNLPLATWMAPA